jgi:hypothetical protein
MMRKKTGFKKFLELNGLKRFFCKKYYKRLVYMKLDIYKCPFLKKILKIFFRKKSTYKNLYKLQTIKGHTKIFSKKGPFKNFLV